MQRITFDKLGLLASRPSRTVFVAKKLPDQTNSPKVLLKNNTEVSQVLLDYTLNTLKAWNQTGSYCDPMSVLMLVNKCRNPNFKIHNYSLDRLKSAGFLNKQGEVVEDVKNIVLSACETDKTCNAQTRFVDPVMHLRPERRLG